MGYREGLRFNMRAARRAGPQRSDGGGGCVTQIRTRLLRTPGEGSVSAVSRGSGRFDEPNPSSVVSCRVKNFALCWKVEKVCEAGESVRCVAQQADEIFDC